MNVSISIDSKELGKAAGNAAAQFIKEVIEINNTASIIMATGASQFETIHQLTADKDIDWSKVTMFHLDEYIGLPVNGRASKIKWKTYSLPLIDRCFITQIFFRK